jgi:berberine-like enzyme
MLSKISISIFYQQPNHDLTANTLLMDNMNIGEAITQGSKLQQIKAELDPNEVFFNPQCVRASLLQ